MRGFTLVEVIVVLSIIMIILGFSFPFAQGLKENNSLRSAEMAVKDALVRAQILSQSVSGDSSWGVKLDDTQVVIFKGASYSVRDGNFDEVFSLPSQNLLSGISEMVFDRLSGKPSEAGEIIISNNNKQRIINVNEKGFIED